MTMTQTRRRFLTTASMAGAASLVRAPLSAAAEGSLETTTVRIAKNEGICIAAQYIANDLLRAEGFTDIRHVFVMTGADPCTAWLGGCIALDDKGLIKTGPDLSHDDLGAAAWPLTRSPHLLETSLPGVFAVGDVRSGNIKRVASAVGEGSIAVSFVHRALHE